MSFLINSLYQLFEVGYQILQVNIDGFAPVTLDESVVLRLKVMDMSTVHFRVFHITQHGKDSVTRMW